MSRAARSLAVFGVYLLVLGSALVVAPNLVLAPFGMPEAQEVWIRVVGMLVLILGVYDWQAARAELTAFFRWSVWLRGAVILFFGAFVLLQLAPPVLLVFGAIDFTAAAWTAVALRADARTA